MENKKRFIMLIVPIFIFAIILILTLDSYIFCQNGLWTIAYSLTAFMLISIILGFVSLIYEKLTCTLSDCKRPLSIPDSFEKYYKKN
jgi:hypothetical protein